MTPAVARLAETHTAYVLLLPDVAVKWKKPVSLGFVDFRTPESRERACQQEVDLNRRLAPDVYQGVGHLLDAEGRVVEPVVLMQRLPDDRRLSRLLAEDDVRDQLAAVARLLVGLHARGAPSADGASIAGVERLQELWRLSTDALRELTPLGLERAEVERVVDLGERYLSGHDALFVDRVARGHVRDGHGDLLAEDIFCLTDGPRILDCLDFDPALRQGDVLNDLAMLVMDLERLGHAELGDHLVAQYQQLSGEQHPSSLLHFYVAYRAVVRAKVAMLRAAQLSEGETRCEQLGQARALVRLATGRLERAQTTLVLVGGLPGTGKSTLADALSARLGALVIGSDLVRQELRIPRVQRYARAWKDEIYRIMLHRAGESLARGWDVVLDATWSDQRWRDAAAEVAQARCSTLVAVECRVPTALAMERLRVRTDAHGSEADPAVHQELALLADPWPTATPVDTGRPVDDVVEALLAADRMRGLVS